MAFCGSKVIMTAVNPKPTLFLTREASEPCSRGQRGGALNATPHPPKGDVAYAEA